VAVYAVPLLAIALSALIIFQGPAVRALGARLRRAVSGRLRAPRLAAS
jgi:lipopolysaccharide export system permease protein